MTHVKRWAFLPLLLLALISLGGGVAARTGHALWSGNVIGLLVAIPVALVIVHRRRLRGR